MLVKKRGKSSLWVSLALLLGASACGNLSNDDLLFLSAVPKAEEVEMTIYRQSAAGQALTFAEAAPKDAEYYSLSASLAGNFNVGVEGLLQFVDSLGKGYPPTRRTENERIWGPVRNVDRRGFTLQLEIQRQLGEEGAPRFVFCLYVGRDEEITGEAPACGAPEANGFASMLSGHYDPKSQEGGARSGDGALELDFEAALHAGAGKPEDRGVITLTYDFSGDGASKQIHIETAKPVGVGESESLRFDYGRTQAGHVDFSFSLGNFLDAKLASGKRQDITLEASWQEGAAGRADAVLRRGDLLTGQHAAATECWDAQAKRTYLWGAIYQNGVQQLLFANEGDARSCPE